MRKSISRSGKSQVPRRLKRLIEAHQCVADMESLETLLPMLLDLARNVTNAEAASYMRYDPKQDILEFACARDEVLGEEAAEILKKSVRLKMGEGIAGWVAQQRRSVIVKDARNDPRFSVQADKCTGFVTRNLLSVPLVYGKELLGVINVINSKEKPTFEQEDEEVLECFANLASTAIVRSRIFEARLRQQKLEVQLEAASQIQALFWPKLPEFGMGSHVWGVSVPAAFVGGDVYDIIPKNDGSWLVYVADVSDKGLAAALVMVALWTKLRDEGQTHEEVDELLEVVNNDMYDLLAKEGFFATIVVGRYWPESGKMELARGGHLPPVWVAGDGLIEVPHIEGMTLGVVPDARYEKKEIMLSPGESILLVTDGVTEAENEEGQLFGMSGLTEYLTRVKKPPYGKILLAEINEWRGNAQAADDLTMLEIWRDPP
ncbi:MAG: SpoIIE family protein phosphatase [Deltaproteobacteria bacterium]|nr:SpoIIE family protein phosphatase [Deltaproteobacteria bacterium]MBW2072547.1 SpoIIE family protein phosphatase [Deltaproteobacteria bacterium]